MLYEVITAGLLWDQMGAPFTFYAGAAFAVITLMSLILRPLWATATGAG